MSNENQEENQEEKQEPMNPMQILNKALNEKNFNESEEPENGETQEKQNKIQNLIQQPDMIHNPKLPLKYRIIRKLIRIKNKLPLIGKDTADFIAYISGKRYEIKGISKQFFELNDTKYFINRDKMINWDNEKKPVLLYKSGVSEPVDPKAKNDLITFSKELSTAVEGKVIQQFNATDLNIPALKKIIKGLFYLGIVGLMIGFLIIISLIQNNLFIGMGG